MMVVVKTEQAVNLHGYYVMRGVSVIPGGQKKVIAEREFPTQPLPSDITKFIMETGCDFVSVVTNYRIIKDDALPFA